LRDLSVGIRVCGFSTGKMAQSALLCLLGLLVVMASAAKVSLSGYFCSGCPANPDPNTLVKTIHPAYSTVIFAFIGWDLDGNVVNGWDCNSPTCQKKFNLTKEMVMNLKSEGRTVLISMGGSASPVLTGNESPQFVSNLVSGILKVVETYDFDGVDFDIEVRSGDAVDCAEITANIITKVKRAKSSLIITLAPQMVDLYPPISAISLGFNAQAPVVNLTLPYLKAIQIQMYNSWAQVETIEYAEQYVQQLVNGYDVYGDGKTFHVRIPASKIVLGYPASTSGASSGFLDPNQVITLIPYFENKGIPIGGLMTWCIGWDQIAGWQFANAVASL